MAVPTSILALLRAIAGATLVIPDRLGAITLSADQLRRTVFRFTGKGSAAVSIVLPASELCILVANDREAGLANVSLGTSSISVSAGEAAVIYSDGSTLTQIDVFPYMPAADARALLEVAPQSGDGYTPLTRNALINGDFGIWQRAPSQTSNGYGSDDRWYNGHSGSSKTHSRQAFTLGQTLVPGNPSFFSRTVVTSVAGAGNYCVKVQRIEGVETFSGQEVTLSFWAASDNSRAIALSYVQYFGTGGSPSAQIETHIDQVVLTTTMQRFDLVFTLPSVSGQAKGSNGDDSIQIVFWFDAGSTYNSQSGSLGQQSGTFDIAHVSLRLGDQTEAADPFPYSPNEQERCERYCQSGVATFSGTVTNGVSYFASFQHRTLMRAAPVQISRTNGGDSQFPTTDAAYDYLPTRTRVARTADGTGADGFFETLLLVEAEI